MSVFSLSKNEEDRVGELHEKSIILVMHSHNPLSLEVPRMLTGGVTGMVLKMTADVKISGDIRPSSDTLEGFARAALVSMNQAYSAVEESEGKAMFALKARDIELAKKGGKVVAILGNEGGKLLEGDLALLRMFHRFGLREMQLTWAVPNQLCMRLEGKGLTDFGRDVVKEMNRLGMIIDVSHLWPKAFTDVLEVSEDPVVISHGIVGMEQSLEQHRAMCEKGGVLGVHFYYTYLRKEGKAHVDVEDLLDQIDYLVENLGIDHVGLGADFFPSTGAWADFQHAQGTHNIEWAIKDVSEMPKVTKGLVARGYSEGEIKKILGENFLRLCKRVFGA